MHEFDLCIYLCFLVVIMQYTPSMLKKVFNYGHTYLMIMCTFNYDIKTMKL